jgi:hypothetical protein
MMIMEKILIAPYLVDGKDLGRGLQPKEPVNEQPIY